LENDNLNPLKANFFQKTEKGFPGKDLETVRKVVAGTKVLQQEWKHKL
jgi:hypothetical protein